MKIGILGSGLMGGKLGTIFARAGHEVVFSYARNRQKLEKLARGAQGNARAGTPDEAARGADAVLFAVHWSRADDVLKQAGNLSGKVIVTCSLPMNAEDTGLVIAHTSSGAEELSKKAPRAHVVSAFGTVPSEVLFHVFETKRKAKRPSMLYCGDDKGAKEVAAGLTRDAGFEPEDVVQQIEHADQVGLDVFGVGEHHRQDYLDSAPAVILGAAAARTQRIRLTSAVTVLSSADPVRVFQNFATVDLLSQGRAEMVVGRGSFIDSFPLFGLRLEDYDSLFAENLDLLLKIRENEHVHWSGKHRAALTGQGVYPRAVQNPLPIWLGVGGSPPSFARAGALGLPLMVAIIGGETRRFRPLIDVYREAARQAGFPPDRLKVGVHSPGYVASTTKEAADNFLPGFARAINSVAEERGWRRVTRADFEDQLGPEGALLVGNAEEVAAKIRHHSEALGGIDRVTFQLNASSLPHAKLMQAIEMIGARVAPALRGPG